MEAVESALSSVDDYLRGEAKSNIRHEFVAGVVYAMAGASEEHNQIAGNLYTALRAHLRGGPWRVFMADMKLQAGAGQERLFYYPDVIVTCDPRDTDRYLKRFPKVVIEVLSPETERSDRREKFMAYSGIDTVEHYVLVAQSRREVTLFSRSDGWAAKILTAPNKLNLLSIDFSIGVAAIYQDVSFPA